MAVHKPLVLIDGVETRLPDGDTIAGGGGGEQWDANNVVYEWDFLNMSNSAGVWEGGGISAGTNNGTTASPTNPKHPGIRRLNSVNGTANSGYRYTTSAGTTAIMQLSPGMRFLAIVQTVASTNHISNIGFINQTGVSDPSNGAFFRLQEDALYAVHSYNGANLTATLASTTYGSWYTLEVEIVSDTVTTFNVYNEDGTLHDTATLTQTMPTVGIGCGIVAYNATSSPPHTNLIYLDYLRLEIKNIGRFPK